MSRIEKPGGSKMSVICAERRRIGAGEDAAFDPRIGRRCRVLPDRLDQPAPGGAKAAVGHTAELAVVRYPDVFQHAQRHQGVEPARDIAVVVLDELHPRVEPLGLRSAAGEIELPLRDIERLDGHAVVSGHQQCQAPSRRRFRPRFARPQPQFPADVIELGQLGVFERHRGIGEIRPAIDHLAVEPQPVKVVANVVMMVDVLPAPETVLALRDAAGERAGTAGTARTLDAARER